MGADTQKMVENSLYIALGDWIAIWPMSSGNCSNSSHDTVCSFDCLHFFHAGTNFFVSWFWFGSSGRYLSGDSMLVENTSGSFSKLLP